jgi:hypothetical protein
MSWSSSGSIDVLITLLKSGECGPDHRCSADDDSGEDRKSCGCVWPAFFVNTGKESWSAGFADRFNFKRKLYFGWIESVLASHEPYL